MKKYITLSVLAVVFLLTSCSAYMIKSEQPVNATFKNYKTIVCSWLDLKEADYKKYHYESKDEWIKTIKDVNITGLRPNLKDELSEKKLVFLDPGAETTEADGLLIKFNVDKVALEWSGFTGGTDKLHLNMEFIDIKTKKSLYKTNMIVTSKGPYITQMGFGNRLKRITYHLADFISTKFE